MRLLFALLIVSLLVAACESTAVPTVPPINIIITVVDDTEALAGGVAMALTGTAQMQIGATETVLAQGGVTLTPSPTLTPSNTPLPEPTRFVSPTPTLTPSITPTPTFMPFPTYTPEFVAAESQAWLRVVHAWPGELERTPPAYDVYLNGDSFFRSLELGRQSTLQQVMPGVVEVALRGSGSLQAAAAPLLSQVVQVEPGQSLTVVIAEDSARPGNPALIPVKEDPSPVPTGFARLTILQANAQLFPADLLLSSIQRALAYNLRVGQVVGPVDVPIGSSYLIDLYDTNMPDVVLETLPAINLDNRLSYLLVLAPSRGEELTGTYLFNSSTLALPGDIHARFVNLAINNGAVQVVINNQVQFGLLPLGLSAASPISTLGNRLVVRNPQGFALAEANLGPWTNEADSTTDKIVLLYDSAPGALESIGVTTLSQNAPRSAINANVRLIHAMPGFIPLNLEVRPQRFEVITNAQGQQETRILGETDVPWVNIAQADFSQASNYVSRTPEVYNVRVVLSGTRNAIAQMNNVQLRASGVYDFIVMPDRDAGTARLELVEPHVQVAPGQGDPAAVIEAVNATLTAVAPPSTPTEVRVDTATPTRTPVLTNTPRPTNTPSFPPASLAVDPAPPNTVSGSFLLFGQNFPAERVYSVFLGTSTTPIQSGTTDLNGGIAVVVVVPDNLSPGPYIVRVCVGICPGPGTEAFAVVNVAALNLTPTPTPQP